MAATWTTPTDFASGTTTPLSVTVLNNLLGANGNEAYLLAGIHASGKFDNGSDITTSSTTFVATNSGNLAKTVTLNGTKALIVFQGVTSASVVAGMAFDINVNGARWSSTGVDGRMMPLGSTTAAGATVVAVIDGLTPGSNTFQLLWKMNGAGTATLRAGAGVAGTDFIPAFDIIGW